MQDNLPAIHGSPAHALASALRSLTGLSTWIGHTADPDFPISIDNAVLSMRQTASDLRTVADHLDSAADAAIARPRPSP